MKIYRIEEKNSKLGPFRFVSTKTGVSMFQSLLSLNLIENWDKRTPDEDLFLSSWWQSLSKESQKKYIFGFKSLVEARNYFSELGNDFLHYNNFHISEYESDKCFSGIDQVIFDSETSIKTNEFSLILEMETT